MNKADLVSVCNGLYPIQNQGEIVRGKVSIEKQSTAYIGLDKSYAFGQTIQLMNEDFLKVAPLDLIYRVQVVTNLPNDKIQIEYKELPSCLFSQALIDNKVCYIQDGRNYELQLAPYVRLNANYKGFKQEIPFHECVTSIEAHRKDPSIDFYADIDIPYNYLVKYEGLFNTFNSSLIITPGIDGFQIFRNNFTYTLSPNTQRIQLDQLGVSPLNFDELQLVDCQTEKTHLYERLNKAGLTLAIEAPGQPLIEILLDGNHLYVTQEKTNPDFAHHSYPFSI